MSALVDRLASSVPAGGTVLDIGALDVNGTYRPLIERRGWRYVGIDQCPGPNVDLVDDGYVLGSVADETGDLIVSGQALEHMEFPLLAAMAMKRVLRPGGWLVLIAPNAWPEHRHPIDCWRVLPDGMRFLLQGMEEVVSETSGADTWGMGRKPRGYVERWSVIDHAASGRVLGRGGCPVPLRAG